MNCGRLSFVTPVRARVDQERVLQLERAGVARPSLRARDSALIGRLALVRLQVDRGAVVGGRHHIGAAPAVLELAGQAGVDVLHVRRLLEPAVGAGLDVVAVRDRHRPAAVRRCCRRPRCPRRCSTRCGTRRWRAVAMPPTPRSMPVLWATVTCRQRHGIQRMSVADQAAREAGRVERDRRVADRELRRRAAVAAEVDDSAAVSAAYASRGWSRSGCSGSACCRCGWRRRRRCTPCPSVTRTRSSTTVELWLRTVPPWNPPTSVALPPRSVTPLTVALAELISSTRDSRFCVADDAGRPSHPPRRASRRWSLAARPASGRRCRRGP